jgi:DNA-binding transcriptional regulator YiaG
MVGRSDVMQPTVTAQLGAGHLLRSDVRKAMAKASLADVRKADEDAWKTQIGAVVRLVRGALSLKEFADLIDRDERQIARWEEGKERPQFDALFSVPALQGPLVLALADLTNAVEVSTQITIRRRA